ncbi:Leptomycin B resistance protein pmd1-like protein 4 [Pleurostoma richardsiae]|uniref:Leptomycin B resistance protein pmd1-like protein 4 n=1 Tax=Pleurostoma richardsiae TaxID=41990 RepID=A0AA38RPW5_9PEZI|nr:Leptomycin B resistance protein pmd1-like protein 4 [Pleurostoma richardsiae]
MTAAVSSDKENTSKASGPGQDANGQASVTDGNEVLQDKAEKGAPLLQALSNYLRLLFYGAEWLDYVLITVATICAIAAGVPYPLMGILFGQLVDDINGATCEAEGGGNSFSYESTIRDKVLKLVYVAIGAFVVIYAYVLCWSIASQRLAQRLRHRYFESLLRQDPAFFGNRTAGEVSSRLQGDIQAVQTGTSEKVGVFIGSISFFVTAYIIAFIKEARLAGMLISLVPAFLLMALIGGAFIQKFSGRMSDAVGAASSIASEALTHVSVVQSFTAAPRLEAKFAGHMAIARKAGIQKAAASALQAGLLYFIAYSANALAFWQGSRMVAKAISHPGSGSSIGQIYTVIFILVDACVVLGSVAPLLPLFGGASSAFQRLLVDIERGHPSEPSLKAGAVLPVDTPGSITFSDVSFAYPSRPDTSVLRSVNLTFPAGKHTAIVGPSGSGKSTIASLITKLLTPTEGLISLDGHDLRDIDSQSLRSFIGVVQQEPMLLNRSIMENIALGLVNSPHPEHASLKEVLHGPQLAELPTAEHHDGAQAEIVRLVHRAAELADVSAFVDSLEHGYATATGPGGARVSGGQRQRIALARALVRDPKILLLDEATASLDSTSERHIQAALERAAKHRTVISIAHRLSTVKNADNIVVLQAGEIVEQGSYAELVARGGVFARMVSLQALGSAHDPEVGSVSNSISTASLKIDDVLGDDSRNAVVPGGHEPTKGKAEDAGSEKAEAPQIGGKMPFAALSKGLAKLIKPSRIWLVPALFASFLVGCTFSASGLIFGFTVGELNPCNNTPSHILNRGLFFSGMLFMLAVVELAANAIAWSSFGLIAERLLYAVRVLSLRSLLEQDIDWHQSAGRTPSSLLSIITKDSAAVGSFSGSIIGTVLSIIISFVVAVILSHIIAWKIALVCLAVVPVLLAAGLFQLRSLARFEERHAEAYATAVGIAVEAVTAIQTVAAYSLEDEVLGGYNRALQAPRKEMVLASARANVWLAVSNSVGFLVYALAYWWGSHLIMKDEYSQKQFFIVLVAMLVSAQLWGQMFALSPEFSRARAAISRILGVMKLGSSGLAPMVTVGGSPSGNDVEATAEVTEKTPSGARGVKVTLDSVSFSYPSRPDVKILKDVSITIQPGQFCGLVGPSGAGKSTIMGLIQGLYRPTSGTVAIDGISLSRPSALSALRADMAVVPQDPCLFDGSIRFNVGLGARPGHDATDEEIEAACRAANIHETIIALPQGYDTDCGPGATQLSGGQRQRVAIARALVRKPRLLLLDESTSALDAESERALQKSLEEAARDVTVVAITHRLHTVQRADVIFVVEGGRVVDSGKHGELLERSESYRVNAQQQMLQ